MRLQVLGYGFQWGGLAGAMFLLAGVSCGGGSGGADINAYSVANRPLIAALPSYAGATLMAEANVPYSGDADSAIGYWTFATYDLNAEASLDEVAQFFVSQLKEWSYCSDPKDFPEEAHLPAQAQIKRLGFVRGAAVLVIGIEDRSSGGGFNAYVVGADHAGYIDPCTGEKMRSEL